MKRQMHQHSLICKDDFDGINDDHDDCDDHDYCDDHDDCDDCMIKISDAYSDVFALGWGLA